MGGNVRISISEEEGFEDQLIQKSHPQMPTEAWWIECESGHHEEWRVLGPHWDTVCLIKQVPLNAVQTSTQLSPGGHTGGGECGCCQLTRSPESPPQESAVLSYKSHLAQGEGSELFQALNSHCEMGRTSVLHNTTEENSGNAHAGMHSSLSSVANRKLQGAPRE